MAKKGQLDFGTLDIDSDLDFDFGDFEDSKPEASSKREAVIDVAKSVGEGAKASILNTENIRKALKSSLPSGMVGVWDTYDKAASTASALYDQASKELKPGLSTITKKLDNLVPAQSTRLKKVTGKLHDMLKVESGDGYSWNHNIEEQGVSNMLKGVFATQMEQQTAERDKEDTENKLRDRLEENRHSGQMNLFARMDNNLQRLGEYTTSPNMAFQKKSLELQFRTYFTLGEMLKQTKESAKQSKSVLDGILKNTALPEFVKIKESERFKQIAKDKLWTGLHNRMFGEGTRIDSGLKKLREKGGELIEGIQQGLEAGVDFSDNMETMAEANDSMAEMGGKKKTSGNLAGEFIGNLFGKHVLSKVGGVVKQRIDGNEKLQRWDQNLSRWVANPDELINSYNEMDSVKDADLDESLKSKFMQAFGGVLEMFKETENDVAGKTGYGTENLLDSTYTDERSRRAQVDVIPGYLARILREVTVLRTNDDSQALTVYDFGTGKFKTQTQLSQDIKDSLKKKFKSSSLDIVKHATVGQFMGEGEGTAEEREALGKALTNLAREKGLTLDKKHIVQTTTYSNMSDQEKELLEKHVFSKTEGDSIDSLKNKTKLTTSRNLLRESMVDIEKDITQRIQAGQMEELEETGIITVSADRKTWKINQEKYLEMSNEATMATSDINKKTGISKLSPKAMLEKIKKIGVFNWKYKKGEGPQDQSFNGPMAQDVNKELGEEVAPGGKKIDLVSMNGANMSAIQGLSEEVEKIKGGETKVSEDTDYLKQISANTFKLVQLVEGDGPQSLFRGFKMHFGGKASSEAPSTQAAPATTGDPTVKETKETGNGDKGTVVKDTTSLVQAAIGILSKGLFKGSKKIAGAAKGTTDYVGKKVEDNADNIKDARRFATESLFKLVGKGLNFGSDVLFKYVPNAVGGISNLFKSMSQQFKKLVNGAQDLYKEGMDSPVIQAQLMKSGYYIDQATGKPIYTIDELRAIKGHVVNHLGEVVVTAEDVARGLYNSKGDKIQSTALTLGRMAAGLGMWAGKKAWDTTKNLSDKGLEAYKNIPGIDAIKGHVSNALTGFKDRTFGAAFGGRKKTLDVLIQIRDLVSIGKPKKLVDSILNRTLGKEGKDGDDKKSSKSWMDILKKDDGGKGGVTNVINNILDTKGGEGGSQGPQGPSSTTQSSGIGGMLLNGFNKARELFQPKKEPGKDNPNFVGPHLPELVGPVKPLTLQDQVKGSLDQAKRSLPGITSLVENIVQKTLSAKDKLVKKDTLEMVGPPLPDMVGPQRPGSISRATSFIQEKLLNNKGRAPEATSQPEPTGPAPELVGPQRPARRGKFGMLMNGLSAGKNMVVGAASKLGGIAGALMPSAETPQQDTGPKSIGDRFSGMLNTGKNQIRGMLKRKGAKFNDGDGDGSRDGNAVEQLKKQEDEKQQRLEANKASAEAAAERANEGIKYKSSENVIDTIAKKAGALFDMMKGGIGGFLETAASFLSMDKLKGLAQGAWAAIKNPIKTLRGIGTGVKALGTAAKVGGVASTVMRVANVARTGLMVGGLAMGGTGGVLMSAGALALTGITTALASPVVLGALAVAGTAAAGYYAYKRFTRDNLDPWETLRAMQYGLPGNSSSKEYNHVVMNLERYFLDGKIGYQDGKAYLLDKKIDPKEIFSIFSIDTGDKEAASTLSGWLQKRFKPFFLNAVTAMYAVDPKLGLEDLSKLKVEQKKKLLPMVQFLEGPYNETDSPFKNLDVLGTDTEMIKAQVAIIEKQLTKEEGKNEKPSDKFDKTISDIQKAKAEKDAAAKAASDKAMVDKLASKSVAEKPLVEKAGTGVGNQGGYNTPSPTAGSTSVATPMMFDEAKPVGNNASMAPAASVMGSPYLQRAVYATDSAVATPVSPSATGNPVATVAIAPAASTPVKGVKQVKMSDKMLRSKQIINEAAARAGVDPRYLQIIAAIESRFDPDARAGTSSATGLFQFVKKTWRGMLRDTGKKYNLGPDTQPTDPVANSLMGAEFLKANIRELAPVKKNPSITDLYMAHFMGGAGARKFFRTPTDAPAAKVFPDFAISNPDIFWEKRDRNRPFTIAAVYQNFENKLKRLAASYGIEFPTTGSSMVTGNPPAPPATGPKEPPPLPTVGTTKPMASTPPASDRGGMMNAVATPENTTGAKVIATGAPPSANPEVKDFQKNSGLYKQPESTTPATTVQKDNWQSNNQYKQQPNTIPGVSKPTSTVEQAVEVKPEPKKKYPWVIDERPDDIAVGRASNTSKSGEALYGAMDGVKSTMSQQLIVSTEMRDVLKDRVAPALEKMLEVLAGAKSAAPATTPTPPSKVAPTPVRPATQSFLDLKRMA